MEIRGCVWEGLRIAEKLGVDQITDNRWSRTCHCEERSDVAISPLG